MHIRLLAISRLGFQPHTHTQIHTHTHTQKNPDLLTSLSPHSQPLITSQCLSVTSKIPQFLATSVVFQLIQLWKFSCPVPCLAPNQMSTKKRGPLGKDAMLSTLHLSSSTSPVLSKEPLDSSSIYPTGERW